MIPAMLLGGKEEPIDRYPASRHRTSTVDPYREQIEQWLQDGLSIVRMFELARADAVQPFRGGRSAFSDRVRQIRAELAKAQADVPMRFEGLPDEYLQVDWGEVRRFPFTRQPPVTRYVLCCRLKYSRWSWMTWTSDMRQETQQEIHATACQSRQTMGSLWFVGSVHHHDFLAA